MRMDRPGFPLVPALYVVPAFDSPGDHVVTLCALSARKDH